MELPAILPAGRNAEKPVLKAAAIRARLLARANLDQAAIDDGRDLLTTPPIPAAVLVPVIWEGDGAVLLTKRTAHLSAHAGQVSFPGGRIDSTDASPESAALREAAEEIGLAPDGVELAGRLPDYVTGTGFLLTPVLGLLPAMPALRPSAEEVETVFTLPLPVLLDPSAPQRKRALFRGAWRPFWVWPHPDHHIWGATAAILVQLAERLRSG